MTVTRCCGRSVLSVSECCSSGPVGASESDCHSNSILALSEQPMYTGVGVGGGGGRGQFYDVH